MHQQQRGGPCSLFSLDEEVLRREMYRKSAGMRGAVQEDDVRWE